MIRPDELYHHGVKGMKWGVRRYQNYDGSRIKNGKKPVYKYRFVPDDDIIFPKALFFPESRKKQILTSILSMLHTKHMTNWLISVCMVRL